MNFTEIMVQSLCKLSDFSISFGWGIILLTLFIRICLWPLNVSQQRSMKKMQTLTPKIKALQERYKNDPQTMQTKMMEFYKENKFNPFAGCLPLLVQMPIFILLYTALISPQFIQVAGDTSFGFINRLDSTLKSQAGVSYDKVFSVTPNDTFTIVKTIEIFDKDGNETGNVKTTGKKPLQIQGGITPGENIDFKINLDNLDLKYSQLEKIEKATVKVMDNNSKEIEVVNFEKKGSILAASVPTKPTVKAFHTDVLFLIIIFGISMFVSQKVMMATNKTSQVDEAQLAMQKSMGTFMPLMIIATFIIIPIPAGVLLYLVVSNIFQVFQTLIINKQIENEEKKPKVIL